MIFAIDSVPNVFGGRFSLIVGGIKPTPEENKLISEAFSKAILPKMGETLGDIIEVFN
jgi:hypothetical protein